MSDQQERQAAYRSISEVIDTLDLKLLQYGSVLSLRQLNELYQRLAYLMRNLEAVVSAVESQASEEEIDEWIGFEDVVVDKAEDD